MSLFYYIVRTMLIVVPCTAILGFSLSYGLDLKGAEFVTTIASIIGVGIVVGYVSAYMNHKKFIKPIEAFNDFLAKLEEGDMTDRVDEEKAGELKPLAVSLNSAVSSWANVLENVQHSSKEITIYSAQLAEGAKQTTLATEHISETVEKVAEGAEHQVTGVNAAATVIAEMSSSLTQVASSTENVNGSVNDSLEKAENGSSSIQTAEKQMNAIHENVKELSKIVEGLGGRSKEIGKIVEVISGIAGQTNLLALNASIEAARAGEHGKGFAVVANEVGGLAEQSAQASKQITQLITLIQEETANVVDKMQSVSGEVAEGMDLMHHAGSAFSQIHESVAGVNSQILQVSAAIQQMSAGAQHIVSSIDQISIVAGDSSSAAQTVLAATEQQLASMQEVSSSSSSLSVMAEELQGLTDQFKLN
ncbi:methyl-accepting chemotaxis protein [Fictibacillus iocasae]|uniref:Methyl-accepting chemotaxis protein n=1 Tax=Fictibacillus iocasae TaxID=2715437 RepID=A0ABW2NKR5_9BACL